MNNKQINRVVTPLKVNANGQIVSTKPINNNGDEFTPEIVIKKKKEISIGMILITLLILILISLIVIIITLVLPDYITSTDTESKYNDYEPIKASNQTYKYSTFDMNEEVYLKETGKYKITGIYELSVENVSNDYEISINDIKAFSTKNLLSQAAVIDNLLVLVSNDNNSYTIRIYDKNIKLLKQYDNIGTQDIQIDKIEYKNNRILINESMVQGNFIKIDGEFYNVCDLSSVVAQNINDDLVVSQVGAIEYNGSKKFSDYKYLSVTTLKNKQKNLCK